MKSLSDRELGMDRAIARRDFLTASQWELQEPPDFSAASLKRNPPRRQPTRTILRHVRASADNTLRRSPSSAGSTKASMLNFRFPIARSRKNTIWSSSAAGISGLSAAYFYRAALGAGAKILILDNHDDFGGHAKRNEFHYQGKTFVGYGGTMSIATPFPYSYSAKALIGIGH